MKVGILTQHFLLNYGGIIQNYALQQVLKKLGHEPITFEHDTCYSPLRWFLRLLKSIITNHSLKNLPQYPYKGRVGHKNFIDFIIKNIDSVTIRDFGPNLTNKHGIEAYIVGSDQVWRPAFNLGPRIFNMFLDFVPDAIRKISYAASFGVNEWEFDKEQTLRCKELAQRFDAISVREESGIALCKKYLNVNAIQVLDPTLLLNKEDYMHVCENIPKEKGHIFAYSLVEKHNVMNVANKIATEKKLTITHLEAGDKVKENDCIEKWIAEFRDAEYIVTDSFHGMVFSIIFNKPFYIITNASGGNTRYVSLLKQLGIEDRIVFDGILSNNPIQWDKVNNRLQSLKDKSTEFLTKNLV